MKIALVDDMTDIRNEMRQILRDFSSDNHVTFEIDEFNSGEDLLSDYTAYTYDIIFMDVYMDAMTGIETAQKLRQNDCRTIIIFLTSSEEHMRHAFSTHAFDYIEKPVEKDKIYSTLFDALRILPNPEKHITFSYENIEYRMVYSDIACLYANGHYTQVVRTDGVTFKPYCAFSNLSAPLLEDERFFIVSRGVLCNMDEIADFTSCSCTLACNVTVPVTKRNAKQLQQAWRDYEFAKIHKLTDERSIR